jgi:hypothetical protein
MNCPVCSTVLHAQETSCGSCPMNSGCDMLCCDNCGYETVAPHSVTVDFFRRVWRLAARRKDTRRTAEPTHG